MAGGTSQPGQTVTGRVLTILELFERSLAPRSLTEISSETGLALSTTHRLVGELEAWGALQRDDNGRYQIGLRLWELGQHAGRHVREIARPLLQDLFTLTQETVHLAVRDRAEALYIDRVYGTRRVPQASRVGGRLPLHATAVGKVLLAFEEPWVREAILSQPLERRTPQTHVDPDALRAELALVRTRSFATSLEETRVGATSIAVPVFQGGLVAAALGLVTTSDGTSTIERHLPALRGIARRIESSVGGFPLQSLRQDVSTGRKSSRRNAEGER
ncbi:DNA-binding IclR family transcriptional regulator [Microbacterium ginsengiterrae]|uniref:DNA-binding IclR family transcriptional regulator n=1 Tax=Microbacterium ginsengiterrae TaxID=546115 RepID=A0A7W9CBK3_9MICO|nr:IclR family transcriptional regulator [Microbacterium ginsengiterrae]MBB5742606.1 DNA-binding IclR family transcriptional regulator [Microbacterium ginsengiterrae]